MSIAYLREGRLYRAERRLGVPAASKTLQVAVTADQAVSRPREPGVFNVMVTDQAGQPVRAQVSLAVIDEAVYGVKPDETPDPMRFFYRREYTRVATTFSTRVLLHRLLRPRSAAARRAAPAGRSRWPTSRATSPSQAQVRKDFPDAIYWVGDLVTDAQGRGRIAVTYPDALTTWRLTARAITEDTRAGTGHRPHHDHEGPDRPRRSRRASSPKAMKWWCRRMVHNYQPEARTASVTMQATGLEPVGAHTATSGVARERRRAARRLALRREVASARPRSPPRRRPKATPMRLNCRCRCCRSAFAARPARADRSSAPVKRPPTVNMPETSNPAARSIAIALAPSLAGSLLGALDFLTDYPYGCTEQTVSSFLPNLLVTRALTELKLVPTERLSALDRQVSAGLQRLYDYQHDDGGWGWWKADGNHPFMTAYALWGLDEARARRRQGGRLPPQQRRARAGAAVRAIPSASNRT